MLLAASGLSLKTLQTRSPLWGLGWIALSCAFFASMAVCVRLSLPVLSGPQLGIVRFVFGAGALLLFYAARRRFPPLLHPGKLFLRGALGGIAVLLYFVSISRLGAGPATMLNFLSPIYAALYAVVVFKERPKPGLVLGLLIATAGALVITASTGEITFTHLGIGGVAGLLSGVFGGLAMATVHSLRQDTSADVIFFAFCAVGLLVISPFAMSTPWPEFTPALILIMFAVGAFSLLGQLLYTYGMGFTSASSGSAATQLTPAFTFLFSALFLAEVPQPLTVLGALLCFVGVVVGMISRTR